jgi:16S rRNA (cytidine1402-2'-O)-methyltransferase
MIMPGTLYLVATPIGNLKDITYRAVEVLRAVDAIACEDTRHTRKLLNHLGIGGRLVSYHEHNEADRAETLVEMLEQGMSVAVVSDAGTPGVSDPAFRIVTRAIEIGATVVPIPGPVAFVNGLVASGLPAVGVFFGGFLPSRKTERRRRLREVAAIPGTLAFYESPRRLSTALLDCLEILGDRRAAVARELTKLHEQFHRGTLSTLAREFDAHARGEIVLLIERGDERTPTSTAPSIADRVNELEAEGSDPKSALKQAAREYGVSKSEAYRRIQSEKK